MEEKIKTLRMAFRISNATFSMLKFAQTISSGKTEITEMQKLHEKALIEIEKEKPNMLLIQILILEMKMEANRMKMNEDFEKRIHNKPKIINFFNK